MTGLNGGSSVFLWIFGNPYMWPSLYEPTRLILSEISLLRIKDANLFILFLVIDVRFLLHGLNLF